jgi:chromosome segregation ATPase
VKDMEKEIKNLNNIIINNNNQINYLNDIQESNKLSQKDNEDLILELKNTIENLQKVNSENSNEIIELKNKIEECNNNMDLKQNEINALNDNINEKELIIKISKIKMSFKI